MLRKSNQSYLNKTIVLLICISLINMFILCETIIIDQTDHDCNQINCEICILISEANDIINQLGKLLIYIIIIVALLYEALIIATEKKSYYIKLSPIKLKVRMNN